MVSQRLFYSKKRLLARLVFTACFFATDGGNECAKASSRHSQAQQILTRLCAAPWPQLPAGQVTPAQFLRGPRRNASRSAPNLVRYPAPKSPEPAALRTVQWLSYRSSNNRKSLCSS